MTYRGLHGARVCAWWRGWGWVPSLLFTFVLACSVKKKKNIIIETLGQADKLKPTRTLDPPHPLPHTRRRKPRKTSKPRSSRGVSHYNLTRKSDKLGV